MSVSRELFHYKILDEIMDIVAVDAKDTEVQKKLLKKIKSIERYTAREVIVLELSKLYGYDKKGFAVDISKASLLKGDDIHMEPSERSRALYILWSVINMYFENGMELLSVLYGKTSLLNK